MNNKPCDKPIGYNKLLYNSIFIGLMTNILKNSNRYDIPSAIAMNLKSFVMIFYLLAKLSNNSK